MGTTQWVPGEICPEMQWSERECLQDVDSNNCISTNNLSTDFDSPLLGNGQ
jgi:hypothetical protein